MKNYIPCNNAFCPYGRKTVGMICPAAEMCAGFQYGSVSVSMRTEPDYDNVQFSSTIERLIYESLKERDKESEQSDTIQGGR